ncbi:exonuclease SbcCD subunit D C-terminal domain-containing protein [Cupriavidus pampae]|uniref:Uncharacterized protein n=1 Tax=Cupriavidus pampae TaxID=659251 RepID=A0ABM8Y0T1_9BURK|nr:exonuclease SbcCD subunit D C-terminal domain-containing protein [Cupriavidus pampae]CAG9186327.1 hypothetical protein LMG32289_06375 [Cupriavidus pampae]
MRNIGFHGGHTIYELGPVSDVVLFFDCLNIYAEREHPKQKWSLLTDRLYRRYLRLEDLDAASALMEQARQIFADLPSSAVEWEPRMVGNEEKTWLAPNQPTLADVFRKYFEHFASARSSAESFQKAFNIYQPVRVVISDLPGFARDKNKPLAEYDALEGMPFWLQ